MSTKNLARTVIEPGRTSRFKRFRTAAGRAERHIVARELNRIALGRMDPDGDPFTPRKTIAVKEDPYGEFDPAQRDKLRPIRKWLLSRVDRPWARVYAEISRKFDRRTTPGRHIVECHIMTEIERPWQPLANVANFVVDAQGVLRLGPWLMPRPSTPRAERRYLYDYMLDYCNRGRGPEIERWLGARRVGECGRHLYWFVSRDAVDYPNPLPLNCAVTGFRQDRRFTEADLAFWKTLGPYWHDQILKHSPLNK